MVIDTTNHTSFRLGVDGNEANVNNRVGSNQFAYGLLNALYQHRESPNCTIYLKDTPVYDMPPENPNWKYRVLQPKKMWTQWRLPIDLYTHPKRPQIFFTPGHYAPRKTPIPSAITILDLAFLHFPNLFLKYKRGAAQLKTWTEYSVKQAKHVFTISQSTKNDIIHHYQIKPDSITVIYPGIDTSTYAPATPTQIKKTKQKYNLDDYIIYVGTIQPRKNLGRLLQAFESLPKRFKHNLVITGQKGWLYDDFAKAIDNSPKKDKLRLTGYVDLKDIPALYSGAACSVLIGLHEGFGMPAAEAIACGTVPVVSQTASLPEVVGSSGITVDPYSITSIRHGIISALSLSEEKRANRLGKMQQHITQFTWEAAAKKVIQELYAITIQR